MRKASSSILENWYRKTILLSEALPLSQAKYYSSLEKRIEDKLIEPFWRSITRLGSFTSKRGERVYFEYTAKDFETISLPLGDAIEFYTFDWFVDFYTLLDLGMELLRAQKGKVKSWENSLVQQYTDFKNNPDILEEHYRSSVRHFGSYLEEYIEDIGKRSNPPIGMLVHSLYVKDVFQGIIEHEDITYKLGTAVDKVKNTIFKGTKYAEKLATLYRVFTTRKSGVPQLKTGYIVISRHGYDVAGMSTNRGWRSCMRLPDINDPKDSGGVNANYVECDVAEGTMIAYLVRKNDTNIERPVGRVLIKPYYDPSQSILAFGVETRTYGTVLPSFKKQVEDIIDAVNKELEIPAGVYTLPKTLYADAGGASKELVIRR